MTDMTKLASLEELITKVDKLKKQEKLDLSVDQDLSIAIMNLVSIEEHFIYSGAKTGKASYYELVNEVRNMRKILLKQLVKDVEEGAEVWCISKHLLAAAMRLMEVGSKQLGMGHKSQAYDFYQKAYDLYVLFWGLNMKAIELTDVVKLDEAALNKRDKGKNGMFGKLGKLVKKAIDCCLE